MNDIAGIPISRKELQAYLKARGIRAVGSTEALRAAYYQAHQSGYTVAQVTPSLKSQLSFSQATNPKPAAAAVSGNIKKRATPEKRLLKFQSTCSQQTRARINRAKTQRLYLVQRGHKSWDGTECDFVVLGSTGNVYMVHIGKLVSCNCPDCIKGNLCKHILFVLIKVMGIDSNSPLVYQVALLESELKEMFESMANRRVGGMNAAVTANERVRSAYAAGLKRTTDCVDEEVSTSAFGVERKTLEQNVDCPICFDTMVEGQLTYCRGTCGTNFHSDCLQRWIGQHRSNPTCPNCRQLWQSEGPSTSSPVKEGYTNLGQMQGLPAERDTSTYSSWSPYSYGYNKRRRRW